MGQGEEPAGTDSRRTFSEARLLPHSDPRSRIIKDLWPFACRESFILIWTVCSQTEVQDALITRVLLVVMWLYQDYYVFIISTHK